MPVQHSSISLPLYLLDCLIEMHSDTVDAGVQRGEEYSQASMQDISLHVSLSARGAVIWALIYVLLWQRLTSFLTGSLCACTLGETTKARVYRTDEHREG